MKTHPIRILSLVPLLLALFAGMVAMAGAATIIICRWKTEPHPRHPL